TVFDFAIGQSIHCFGAFAFLATNPESSPPWKKIMPCSSSPFRTAQPRPWAASISALPSQDHSTGQATVHLAVDGAEVKLAPAFEGELEVPLLLLDVILVPAVHRDPQADRAQVHRPAVLFLLVITAVHQASKARQPRLAGLES